MRFPTLARKLTEELVRTFVNIGGLDPAVVEKAADWIGTGQEVNLASVEKLALELAASLPVVKRAEKEAREAELSAPLYDVFSHFPPEVLDNRGFWRYVGVRYFLDFIVWREPKSFKNGRGMVYVNPEPQATEAVLTRMYLRAQVLGGREECARLGASVEKGVDFWRSHVFRVKTAYAPAVARAFVTEQSDNRLKTDDLREVAKRLNRTWANIIPYRLGDAEAEVLIAEVWR